MPCIKEMVCEKVIVINIDGCRMDKFYEAKLPFLNDLQQESSYFPNGIFTVYRALTNPAFASMLTGTIPGVHGIKSNNISRWKKVEALPDLVQTKLYGSIHMKHLSKKHWMVKTVSMVQNGIGKADHAMFSILKNDLTIHDGTRLFIADISETDFTGHAYGSESPQYLNALKKMDTQIKDLYAWLRTNNILSKAAMIICSDHGIVKIDHSYLLFEAEKRVPFLVMGKGIKKDNALHFEASIMDIAPTISYLLGIKYPDRCKARALTEILNM